MGLIGTPFCAQARSPHRRKDPLLPELTARWSTGKKTYSIADSHIEEYPIFKVFSKKYFYGTMLPNEPIPFRNEPEKSVEGKVLHKLIDELFIEIRKKKRKFKHFKVLQKKNFNRRKKCGLIVLKFKEYPFVLKLFMETPKTFVNPHCKGMDNVFFFSMGGGVNRHIAGLTRVKNLHSISKRIADDPEWSQIINTPRKWHWVPQDNYWMHVTGKNIGTHTKPISIELPGVFCVVADAIEGKKCSIINKKHSKMAMNLCNYLDASIDPHIDNFIIEEKTNKIVIIDTEHFPTLVGLKEKVHFNGYVQWYFYLAGKCGRDWFARDKRARRLAQTQKNELALE